MDLREIREGLGYCQEDVTQELGVSIAWLSRRERGETALKVSELLALARLYDLTDAQILELVRGPK